MNNLFLRYQLLILLTFIVACAPALPKTQTSLEVQKLSSSVNQLQQELAVLNSMNSRLMQSNEQLQQSLIESQARLDSIEQSCKTAATKRPATVVRQAPRPAAKPQAEPLAPTATTPPQPVIEQKPKYPEYSPSDAPVGS